MMMNLKTFVNKMEGEIIQSLQELVSIPSFEESSLEGKPFGDSIDKALLYMLNKGLEMGFEVKNVDGYAGHIHWGNPDEFIGVLVHLDVVPEGKNWDYPPYGGEIDNGKIYGRGTIDNKGPAIASLYSMKALKDSGYLPSKGIRLILGLDEESGWLCMDHYFKKEKKPIMGFSPDAQFPIINAEKGIFILKVSANINSLIKINGGDRPNMVPDFCKCSMPLHVYEQYIDIDDLVDIDDVEINMMGDSVEIITKGISAHGSTPEKGKNAIAHMFKLLDQMVVDGEIADFISTYNTLIGNELDGKSLGINLSDEISGNLVLNVGTVRTTEDEIIMEINIRYPVTIADELIVEKIKESLNNEIKIFITDHKKPLYIEEDHPLIQKLSKVYQEYTGEEAYLISIGGGTYARAIENCVAFGPLFPGEEETAHEKNEFIEIHRLIDITNIYALTLKELAE